LLFDPLADRLSRQLVRFGDRLSQNSAPSPSIANSFLLGIGTGFLWAPCAGPILGLILTGAALAGPSVHTAILLLSYAAGAATSLAIALLAGGRAFAALKRSLGAGELIRRFLGVAVLAGGLAVAFGFDRGILTRISLASTSSLEQRLVDRFHPRSEAKPVDEETDDDISTLVPDLSGATAWINSQPLTFASLRGKVVLIDFWTYSCINCLRTLPYVKAWNDRYKSSGLIIIGVHTPEFPFEKDEANVRKAIRDLGISYPVAMDNDYAIWRNFNNEYWPAHYFIDAMGHVRHKSEGEGEYEESEKWIRSLLEEANHRPLPGTVTKLAAAGAELAPSSSIQSLETYVGYEKAQNFASPGGFKHDEPQVYRAPDELKLNQWALALAGEWKDEDEIATLLSPTGSIVFRFHARDLHLVLGPSARAKSDPPVL
jgi:thiol-disulfide isomerase/thioredoxin